MDETNLKLNETQLQKIEEFTGSKISSSFYLTSGAANNIYRVKTKDFSFIVKVSKVNQPHLFEYEAEALNHLRQTQTVQVPEVFKFCQDFLLMEDLGTEHKEISDEAWRRFGEQFGALHQVHSDAFGYTHDNYLGIWNQNNSYSTNWADFYYKNRIQCFLDVGKNVKILTTSDRDGICKIMEKMKNLIPNQEPSLCHGDFWIANIFRKETGKVFVIDPAVHFGLPEADLAMTQMYGVFPEAFYEGYRQSHSLLPDWKERLPLYQLKELILMIAQFEHEESINTLRTLIKKFK